MIRETTRSVSVPWLGAQVIAICGMVVFAGHGLGQEEKGRPPSGKGFAVAPEDWKELAPPARPEVLQRIAEQTRGNHEKIRTWQGTYACRVRQYLSEGPALDQFRKAFPEREVSALWQETEFAMHFAVDMASGSVYRSQETSATRWIPEGSDEPLEIPDYEPVDRRSVVTAEHYLDFDPKMVWPGFVMVPDHPEARGRRAAFRRDADWGRALGHGDLIDPRLLFCLSEDRTFAEELGLLVSAMKGDTGSLAKQRSDELLTVYEAGKPEETWYRLDQTLAGPNPANPSALRMTAICSPAAGFHPVSLLLSADEAGESPIREMQWQWKPYGEVLLPDEVRESLYRDGGKLRYQRELALDQSVLNATIDPSLFTYRGLGVQDGDLVMDEIEMACYMVRNGTLEKLADYDEEYTAAGDPGPRSPLVQWSLAAAGGLALLSVILLVLRIRRVRAA
jgi:hypothetical protein